MTEQDSCLLDVCFFIAQECHASGQYQKAEYWYERALKFDPENSELHYALSYLSTEKKDFNAVVAHSSYAMKGMHGSIAQYNRALALLMLGKYKQGFVDYDARLDFDLNRNSRLRRFGHLPYWTGESCDTLFVSGEQGYGDIFQFSRYIPLITERFNVKKVIFEVPDDCAELFAYNFNSDTVKVVAPGPLPKIDFHIQLVSLCRLFDTRLNTIPPLLLEAQPQYVEKWKDLKGCTGIVISGRKADYDLQVTEWNNRRSVSMEQIQPILASGIKPYFFEGDTQIKSWSDTAGIMANLDLMISVDTGPAHLAGALQIPTWVLQHASPCWRWMLEGPHTPWYSDNLTQFRQKIDGEWTPVIEEVASKLRAMIEQRKAT